MKHIHAVLAVLHSQAEFEFGIAPDIFVHRTAGFLSGQNQMHPQAAPHLGHTDKLPHKIRLFPLQFRKLVNDDKKMGNRLPGLSVLIQSGIGVNVVYTVLVKDPLPAHIFALNGNHGALYLVS